MTNKIPVGVLGGTGTVGQMYISRLENHPDFELSYIAASPSSAGKKYSDAVHGRWRIKEDIPSKAKNMIVSDANDIKSAVNNCSFVFSALEMGLIKQLEENYAKEGIIVVSNCSANRWTEDVPMLIPEINPGHIDIINNQRENHGFNKGFIVVKPNCSLQSYLTPIYALMKEGYDVSKIIVTTMQATSGAGYPGISSLDLIGNIIPNLSGEQEKAEKEPLKILGELKNKKIINYDKIKISAHCNRVPVIDGHTACVSLEFSSIPSKSINLEDIINIWENFRSVPQDLELYSAPKRPIIYTNESDRPQPVRDIYHENGMAVVVGGLEKENIFSYGIKFNGLSHNLIRGAAGGGILNAELLKAKGYLG
jgi:aspartate-semialdehyde dehydrogenase